MHSETTILYVADPMCSWCWGFAPTLKALREVAPDVQVKIVLGGLAPDSDAPMEESMRGYVQQAWKDVAQSCQVDFNFDYWKCCQPRRSTYPSCRAVLVARTFGLESEMFNAIQHAYYQEARNPSDLDVLADVAVKLGIEREDFLAGMQANETEQTLQADFQLRDELGIRSFPSLCVRHQGKTKLLHSGWCSPSAMQEIWRLWNSHI